MFIAKSCYSQVSNVAHAWVSYSCISSFMALLSKFLYQRYLAIFVQLWRGGSGGMGVVRIIFRVHINNFKSVSFLSLCSGIPLVQFAAGVLIIVDVTQPRSIQKRFMNINNVFIIFTFLRSFRVFNRKHHSRELIIQCTCSLIIEMSANIIL